VYHAAAAGLGTGRHGRPMVHFAAAAMASADDQPLSEREQTDESLRVEREKVDLALEDDFAAVDETADAVICRARERADEVLAAARAKTDAETSARPVGPTSRRIIEKERVVEDHVLEEERADADETLREERAEKVSLLSAEREDTDKDLLSERARADEAVARRDEFLGIVSHDLRTMLNAMVGFAALITKEVSQEDHVPRVLAHAQRIQRSGARMNRLIGDLVDVASIHAGVLTVAREPADPAAVVTEAVETFQAQAASAGISLEAEIPVPIQRVPFDTPRILQVLSNLLSNALKFTPRNGRVVVRVERVGDDVRFAVSDTGIGIPADRLEAVFARFLQVATDRRGVGLGLYISKAIVQGHGGTIWAESTLGAGSRFFFTLPISASA
jgi:signal transduction histidine kinase